MPGEKSKEVVLGVMQDRINLYEIIEEMHCNSRNKQFPIISALSELEALLMRARLEAVNWTWDEVCMHIRDGHDLQLCHKSSLIRRAIKDLNQTAKDRDKINN